MLVTTSDSLIFKHSVCMDPMHYHVCHNVEKEKHFIAILISVLDLFIYYYFKYKPAKYFGKNTILIKTNLDNTISFKKFITISSMLIVASPGH